MSKPNRSAESLAQRREWNREWSKRPENAERLRAQHAARHAERQALDPAYKAHRAAYAAAYNVRPEVRESRRWWWRLKAYGLTQEMFEEYLDAQEGCCAFCGLELPKDIGRFSVDHDHSTGQVRGLVHDRCNIVIAAADAHYLGYLGASGVPNAR